MKVTIDRKNCTSCGTCWETCPAFFEMNNEDMFSQVTAQYRGATPGEGSTDEDPGCVQDAADLCPVSIITVVR